MQTIKKFQKITISCFVFFLFAVPASTNYELKGYEFGAGGGVNVNSGSYSLEGIAGETSGKQSSTTYQVKSGLFYVQMANTPPAPVFVNPANWYNKLAITVNTGGNPSDATYAIAISSDNFVTTQYVQNDNTVGNTLGPEDFQSYNDWGGGSGTTIIGLQPNTTYAVKVKARHGIYTEGPYGPIATASTVNLLLSFDIDISSTDTNTAAPYGIAMGELNPGIVTTASNKVWIDFETNAELGGEVYVVSEHGGLFSATTATSIPALSADLASVSLGFGIQGSTATQISGGPLTYSAPYTGNTDNVGIVDSTVRALLNANSAVVSGRASLSVKAKASNLTPAALDYVDTLTFVAAATF